jgi:lactoylglutathione lyase
MGLQQVAIGGQDKKKLRVLWKDILGLHHTGTYKSESENVDEDILRTGPRGSEVEIDIMQPLDPSKSPKVHVPPLNHLGLWIDDLPSAVTHLTKQGVRFTPGGIRKGAGGFDVTFIHPKGNLEFPLSGGGVLLELVQAPSTFPDVYTKKGTGGDCETKRSFEILGVQQIAIGGASKSDLSALWVDVLGLKKVHSFQSTKENVDEDILVCGEGPFAVEVDLMQPLDAAARPNVASPALNHIGLWVDHLPSAVSVLTSGGMRFAPGGIRQGAAGHDVAFIHPKSAPEKGFPLSGEGVLIELVQAPDSVRTAYAKREGSSSRE